MSMFSKASLAARWYSHWTWDQRSSLATAEPMQGGPGPDVIWGTAWLGSRVYGYAGGDTLYGGWGDDWLFGGDGPDFLSGGDGNDWLQGGGGNDRLDGGSGRDTADYSDTPSGVRVDLRSGTVTFPGKPWAPESLISIESVVGAAFADVLLGDSWHNMLRGGAGDDQLFGRDGHDLLDGGTGRNLLDGGAGLDIADYRAHGFAVTVNLAKGTAFGGGASGLSDKLVSIEGVFGGRGKDTLLGNGQANILNGMGGDDVVRGAGGDDVVVLSAGRDKLYGDAGFDTLHILSGHDFSVRLTLNPDEMLADYVLIYETGWPADLPAVVVDFIAGTARLSDGENDHVSSFSGFEAVEIAIGDATVFGGAGAETIVLGVGANDVSAGRGNDVIHGGTSSYLAEFPYDYTRSFALHFDERGIANSNLNPEILRGGSGNDTIFGNGNISWDYDWYRYPGDNEHVIILQDYLYGNGGDDVLHAGLGHTIMSGGSGADDFVVTDRVGTAFGDVYWGDNYTEFASRVEILDYDSGQGDRITIQFEGSHYDARDPDNFRFVGLDTANETLLRGSPSEDPYESTSGRSSIWGFYHDRSDTVVKVLFGEYQGFDMGRYDLDLQIRLKDTLVWDVAEIDILFT